MGVYFCPGCEQNFEEDPELYREYKKKAKKVYCTEQCKEKTLALKAEKRIMDNWSHIGQGAVRRRQRIEQERRELQERLTTRKPSCYG